MFNWFKKRMKVRTEHVIIKKPKEDELIIFNFPAGTTQQQLQMFNDSWKRAIATGENYIFTEGEFEIITAKKEKINWKQVLEDGE